MSTTRRTLFAIALLTGAVAAQQPEIKPRQSYNPEINELQKQVHDLQKQLDEMDSRVQRLEHDQKFRVSPLSERMLPR
jgi:peptidoglycan hydrolase CwlO-like protein